MQSASVKKMSAGHGGVGLRLKVQLKARMSAQIKDEKTKEDATDENPEAQAR